MSEKPKQYLLLVDDYGKGILGALIPSIQYVEIEGMEIKEMTHKMVLVTPNPKEQTLVAFGESASGDEPPKEVSIDSPVDELSDSK